jgi:hypothetical protein
LEIRRRVRVATLLHRLIRKPRFAWTPIGLVASWQARVRVRSTKTIFAAYAPSNAPGGVLDSTSEDIELGVAVCASNAICIVRLTWGLGD